MTLLIGILIGIYVAGIPVVWLMTQVDFHPPGPIARVGIALVWPVALVVVLIDCLTDVVVRYGTNRRER